MDPFLRGPIACVPDDAEGTRYRVLAYLQHVRRGFSERKLYPYLPEVQAVRRGLEELFRRREELDAAMPGELTGWDPATGRALRARRVEPLWEVLDDVYTMALPLLGEATEEGLELREELMAHVHVEPVGLLPLRTEEGYLLLRQGRVARVYTYQVGLHRPDGSGSPEHMLRTSYVADHTLSIVWHYEDVKAELVKRRPEWPHPAMFAFTADIPLPAIETYVPLAKRLVMELVQRGAY